MLVPSEYREVRFRTMGELVEAVASRDVWESPHGYSDIIGGMRIFCVRDSEGNLTGENAVYVRDRAATRPELETMKL